MIKYRLQVRSVQNIAAGKTVLIDLPCGQRYHYIELIHDVAAHFATPVLAAANILEIRIYSNSRIERVISGTQLRDMNVLNGAGYDLQGTNATPWSFPIYLAEPWRESPADQDALAWSTANWLNFQIQVDLGAGVGPILSAFCVVDDFVPPANTNPGIVKWIRTQTVPGGTMYDFVGLDRRDFLQQISIYPDSGGSQPPTQVTFKRNSVILHELTAAANTALLVNHSMVPAPGAAGRSVGIYDLVFDHDGLLSSAVPMDGTRDSLLEISAAGAMSGTQVAIIQRLGPPE